MNKLDLQQDLFTNFHTLNQIRSTGREDKAAGINQVAKKFESMFVHMMLKSMREANKAFEEGSFLNSFESGFHRDMFDQQLSVTLTEGNGIGLAAAFAGKMASQYGIESSDSPLPLSVADEKRLLASRRISNSPAQVSVIPLVNQQQALVDTPQSSPLEMPAQQTTSANASLAKAIYGYNGGYIGESSDESTDKNNGVNNNGVNIGEQTAQDSAQLAIPELLAPELSPELAQELAQESESFTAPDEFVQAIYPYALEAGKELGIAPKTLIAQAALETGWGGAVLRREDGSSSYNLFNIKADQRWQGERVSKDSLEYRQGVALKERSHFRAYQSYQESFTDYVKFIKDSPRYQKALQNGGNAEQYVRELQRAGYATDPNYAQKIMGIMRGDLLSTGIARFKST